MAQVARRRRKGACPIPLDVSPVAEERYQRALPALAGLYLAGIERLVKAGRLALVESDDGIYVLSPEEKPAGSEPRRSGRPLPEGGEPRASVEMRRSEETGWNSKPKSAT